MMRSARIACSTCGLSAAAVLVVTACGAKSGSSTTGRREVPAEEGLLLDHSDSLSEGDLVMGHGFSDHYEVPVRAGDRIAVELTSNAFDPLLEVVAPGAGPIVNDDYEGDRRRSRVDLVAEMAGILKVRVTSYAPDATGEYRVRVLRVDGGGPALIEAPRAVVSGVLAVGEAHDGELREGDATLADGAYYDQLSVEVTDRALELRVTTSEGAPVRVEVLDPRGRALSQRSGATFALIEPGVYRVLVAAAAAEQASSYRATVTGSNSPPARPRPRRASRYGRRSARAPRGPGPHRHAGPGSARNYRRR